MKSEISFEFDRKCEFADCRSCGSRGLLPVVDLGMMPLSDGMLTAEQLSEPEDSYPLELAFCPDCYLVQILETVPPEKLFCQDYPYYSSVISTLLEHSRKNALSLIEKRSLDKKSLVVEIASNDGYLLKNFVEKDVPVLGIDPAEGPALVARKIGVDTMIDFFGKDLAEDLRKSGKRADVIIGNNVLAHVADTNGVVEGMRILLKEDGVGVIEVPYVRDMIEKCQFDTIYHEHLCYFSVTSLNFLFQRNGLYLNEVERLDIHGGSLRLYVEKHHNMGRSVKNLLAEEDSIGMTNYRYYDNFRSSVEGLRAEMRELIGQLKSKNKSIAAYGAAAKGAIMLNYIGAGPEVVDFVADKNVHKQGKYMPGEHIPICEPKKISEEMPDYVMILPWNFKEEIMAQENEFHEKGGKFIVPVPHPVVV